MKKERPSDDYPRVDHARERREFLFQRGGYVGAPELVDLGPSVDPADLVGPFYGKAKYRGRTKTEFNLDD